MIHPLIPFLANGKSLEETAFSKEREATIIFIDLAESTAFKDKYGMVNGVRKVIAFNQTITDIIKKHGDRYVNEGRIQECEICKYIGDEVMVYIMGENSARIAVDISIAIQTTLKHKNESINYEFGKFKAKIGIDIGKVLFARYYNNSPLDPQGLTVDRAARIISLAKPYQILISKGIRSQLDINYRLGQEKSIKLKGISNIEQISEVLWDLELGIKNVDDFVVHMVPSDQLTVSRFIQDHKLLECCDKIDLILYSSETIANTFRSVLRKIDKPIHFRLLIRNPSKDKRKNAHIVQSIGVFVEIMKYNPKVSFSVRFYEEPPMLRAYFFNKRDEPSMEGLFGIYKCEARDDGPRFIGAEDNFLFHSKDRSTFEKHLQNVFQSRFDCLWGAVRSDF